MTVIYVGIKQHDGGRGIGAIADPIPAGSGAVACWLALKLSCGAGSGGRAPAASSGSFLPKW